jgi:hypothetical protein
MIVKQAMSREGGREGGRYTTACWFSVSWHPHSRLHLRGHDLHTAAAPVSRSCRCCAPVVLGEALGGFDLQEGGIQGTICRVLVWISSWNPRFA